MGWGAVDDAAEGVVVVVVEATGGGGELGYDEGAVGGGGGLFGSQELQGGLPANVGDEQIVMDWGHGAKVTRAARQGDGRS